MCEFFGVSFDEFESGQGGAPGGPTGDVFVVIAKGERLFPPLSGLETDVAKGEDEEVR